MFIGITATLLAMTGSFSSRDHASLLSRSDSSKSVLSLGYSNVYGNSLSLQIPMLSDTGTDLPFRSIRQKKPVFLCSQRYFEDASPLVILLDSSTHADFALLLGIMATNPPFLFI
jgi:hypothetical protein